MAEREKNFGFIPQNSKVINSDKKEINLSMKKMKEKKHLNLF